MKLLKLLSLLLISSSAFASKGQMGLKLTIQDQDIVALPNHSTTTTQSQNCQSELKVIRLDDLQPAMFACAENPDLIVEQIRSGDKRNELKALVFEYYRALIRGVLSEAKSNQNLIHKERGLRCFTHPKYYGTQRGAPKFLSKLLENTWPAKNDIGRFESGGTIDLSPELRQCLDGPINEKGKRTPHRVMAFYIPAIDLYYHDFRLKFFEGFFVAVHELSHRLWERMPLRLAVLEALLHPNGGEWYDRKINYGGWSFGKHPDSPVWIGYPKDKEDKYKEAYALAPSMTNEVIASLASACSYEALEPYLQPATAPVAKKWYDEFSEGKSPEKRLKNAGHAIQETYVPKVNISGFTLSPMYPDLNPFYQGWQRRGKWTVKRSPWFNVVDNLFFAPNESDYSVEPWMDIKKSEYELDMRMPPHGTHEYVKLLKPHQFEVPLIKCSATPGGLDILVPGEPGTEGVHTGSEGVHTGSEGIHTELESLGASFPNLEPK